MLSVQSFASDDVSLAEEPSVHLTVGIDTHLWGLSWSRLREVSLLRAGLDSALENGKPVNSLPLPAWKKLHQPLPLGFLAAGRPYLPFACCLIIVFAFSM